MAPRSGTANTLAHVKTPKGTRDWAGRELLLREKIIQTCSSIFERHGAVPLDTPVFELRAVLTEKYGEDSQLIYDLDDQGGEACSLRYDLTVPFARWLAMKGRKKIKRYQIAKVYRRDQPAIARGRLREFTQCDLDIAGVYDAMIPDAEILSTIAEVFEALEMDVTIKINHRKILDGIFAAVRVPREKIRMISSAVDKLDKLPWGKVKKEMVEDKGLSEEIADRIGEIVMRYGGIADMISIIESDTELSANSSVKAGLDDMRLLMVYLEAMGVNKVSLDLSLARGLDYYTGLIYEVVPQQSTDSALPAGIGSIAAGGRYDDLAGMFGRDQIPCVGISFGVDRIFTILEARRRKGAQDDDETTNLEPSLDVFILSLSSKASGGLIAERMAIARELWSAGIRAGFVAKVKPSRSSQMEASRNVPVAVYVGEEELAAGQVRIKLVPADKISANADERVPKRDIGALEPDKDTSKERDRGQLIMRSDMAGEVRKLLLAVKPPEKIFVS